MLHRSIAVCAAVALLASAGIASPASAQRYMRNAPGGHHGQIHRFHRVEHYRFVRRGYVNPLGAAAGLAALPFAAAAGALGAYGPYGYRYGYPAYGAYGYAPGPYPGCAAWGCW